MSNRIIENYEDQNLKCHFCGTTQSIKYEIDVFDPMQPAEKFVKVSACNSCALRHGAEAKAQSKNWVRFETKRFHGIANKNTGAIIAHEKTSRINPRMVESNIENWADPFPLTDEDRIILEARNVLN